MSFLFESAPGIAKEVTDFSATVIELGGQEPQTVIRDNQGWNITVRWQEQGLAVIPGNWIVDAYVESIGPGEELHVGQATSAFAGLFSNHSVTIPVGPNDVPVAPGQQTTPYKLVITLTADDNSGARYAMAGFQEGPILQFYHVGP